MNISFRQLKAFVAVARLGNLGAAADQLCLTRGAISQALKELELQLGTPLFDRAHPHLLLNSEGALLLPLADEMLTRLDDIGELFQQSGEAGGSGQSRAAHRCQPDHRQLSVAVFVGAARTGVAA